jgi:hypothetical protein
MVLVDYIGIFFYMRQYFWPHTVYIKLKKIKKASNLFPLIFQHHTIQLKVGSMYN